MKEVKSIMSILNIELGLKNIEFIHQLLSDAEAIKTDEEARAKLIYHVHQYIRKELGFPNTVMKLQKIIEESGNESKTHIVAFLFGIPSEEGKMYKLCNQTIDNEAVQKVGSLFSDMISESILVPDEEYDRIIEEQEKFKQTIFYKEYIKNLEKYKKEYIENKGVEE